MVAIAAFGAGASEAAPPNQTPISVSKPTGSEHMENGLATARLDVLRASMPAALRLIGQHDLEAVPERIPRPEAAYT